MTENSTVYRVKDYGKHFEVSQSRRYEKIGWIPFPVKHDGKGFRRVAKHEKACELFTAFVLIVQVSGKCPERGLLLDNDGSPITADDLADKTGFRKEIFELAFAELTDRKIGWLEKVTPSKVGVGSENARSPLRTEERRKTIA